MANLLSKPKIYGNTRVSSLYQVMGSGTTIPVLLMGHANDTRVKQESDRQAFPVFDMQETLNYLGADLACPLVRALLEAYNAGCRDIWVYPVAPMSEYIAIPAERLTFDGGDPGGEEDNELDGGGPGGGGSPLSYLYYEMYYDRLAIAYELLKQYDFYHIVVPVDAPFYDSGTVDFLSQLADFCSESFAESGSVAMGVIGTSVPGLNEESLIEESSTKYDSAVVQKMIDDTRIAQLGDKGKFVTVVAGEGTFIHSQTSGVYSRSLEVATAALMATTTLDRAIAGLRIPNLASLSHSLFSDRQIEALAQAKINTVYKTARGRRGGAFEVKLLTDNTAGQDGSDYWSTSQMRTISFIANRIREYGYILVGERNDDQLQMVIKSFLDDLRSQKKINNYSLKIDIQENSKAIVELGIAPVFGIKNILFKVEVGPGE